MLSFKHNLQLSFALALSCELLIIITENSRNATFQVTFRTYSLNFAYYHHLTDLLISSLFRSLPLPHNMQSINIYLELNVSLHSKLHQFCHGLTIFANHILKVLSWISSKKVTSCASCCKKLLQCSKFTLDVYSIDPLQSFALELRTIEYLRITQYIIKNSRICELLCFSCVHGAANCSSQVALCRMRLKLIACKPSEMSRRNEL